MATDAGFHWLRQEFPWEDIEIHGRGDFEDRRHEPARSAWDKYDHIVALAEQYDLELIVRLSNPPAWTRAAGDAGEYAPPDDYDDFARFVEAVVSRYRGRVRYYQLWNEPNIYPEWGAYPISPEDYVELLKAGATAARAADPSAHHRRRARRHHQPSARRAAARQQPQRPGLHAAHVRRRRRPLFRHRRRPGLWLVERADGPPHAPRVLNISHHLFLRDLMVENGDAHKPIWISEMNWNAAPEGVEPRYGRVTLEQQAEYLPLAYERVRHDWPWVGVANTWHLKRATDAWEQNGQPEAISACSPRTSRRSPSIPASSAISATSPPRHDPRSRAGHSLSRRRRPHPPAFRTPGPCRHPSARSVPALLRA